ncbi:MAG: TldD/PmbA family protein [Cyanobacteria bacterium J083]|nr:MAG: TldD/PmbA family protein [Cyanobacteria bacterium J083]
MANVEKIAKYTQDSAEKLGIKKYDMYGASTDETSVQVDRGEPKQVKASQRSSVIVRVWNEKNTVGVTSTTDVDPNGIELALKTAQEASYFGVKENVPDFSPKAKDPLPPQETKKVEPAPVNTLIEKLIEAEAKLLNAHDAIASVPYNGIAQRDFDRFYLNSDGALRYQAASVASIYLYTKTEQAGKKPRSAGAFKISEGVNNLEIEGCIEEAATKTISHLDYQPIKSGKYPIVFSAEAFLSLLGAFSNLFNAQSILDKQSLSTPESLGTQIASPLLNLCDDALHPKNIGGETFDGEGTPTRRTSVITNGVLTNFLHSSVTARRMGAEPTGNANIGAKVTVSPNFFHVFAGESPEEKYSLEAAEGVILIDELKALHAGVNSLQGSFSLPFDGWLIEQGKRTSIEAATVAGDFREVLKSIIYVEKEAEVTPGGVCPRIWVKELSVTGE